MNELVELFGQLSEADKGRVLGFASGLAADRGKGLGVPVRYDPRMETR